MCVRSNALVNNSTSIDAECMMWSRRLSRWVALKPITVKRIKCLFAPLKMPNNRKNVAFLKNQAMNIAVCTLFLMNTAIVWMRKCKQNGKIPDSKSGGCVAPKEGCKSTTLVMNLRLPEPTTAAVWKTDKARSSEYFMRWAQWWENSACYSLSNFPLQASANFLARSLSMT